jgi:hypothetical protein
MLPSITPFSIAMDTNESSNLENKTESKHDAASSTVEAVLLAIDCNIISRADPDFMKSSLYHCKV